MMDKQIKNTLDIPYEEWIKILMKKFLPEVINELIKEGKILKIEEIKKEG